MQVVIHEVWDLDKKNTVYRKCIMALNVGFIINIKTEGKQLEQMNYISMPNQLTHEMKELMFDDTPVQESSG